MTEPRREERSTDWPAIVGRLERYQRHLDIGLEVGRSESWVCRLKQGIITDPPHSLGEKLKEMDRDLAQRLAAQEPGIPSSVCA